MNYIDLLIGALIGFLASLLTTIVTKKMDSLGELKLYTKIVHVKNNRNWGFIQHDPNNITLYIPLWIQIQNTSSTPKIVRDFNLHAYNNKHSVGKATQINSSGKDDNRITYGNNGAYTFVIEPLSIKHYECLFTINNTDIKDNFDELRVSFFDTKDEEQTYLFKEITNCWNTIPREIDLSWNLVKPI